jgi:O-antigen/teichoic acid export membrane protein
MIKSEILSIFNRVFGLISALLLVIMNLHFVHVEGQGTIALINFGILIVATLSQFIGGGALIYLIPRIGEDKIIFPALVWISISVPLTSILLFALNAPFISFTLILGTMQAIFVLQQMILLGKEKILSYQILLLAQSISSLLFVAAFYFATDWGVMAFISGQIIAFAITSAVGFFLTKGVWKSFQFKVSKSNLYTITKLGGYAQLANVFHLGNQRSYLYFLENAGAEGKVFAGVFSILLYVSEALWTVAKSLSFILASKVAQTNNFQEHVSLMKRYLTLGVITSVVGSICFLIIPNNWLAPFVNYDIAFIKEGFFFLAPGIVANTINVAITHLFSGRGLHKYNFLSAALGFTVAIVCASILTPKHHVNGAAVSASAAFIAQCLSQVILFYRLKKQIQSI